MRVACPSQRHRSNVPDEPFFRRRVPHVWHRCPQIYGERPGRPCGPNDIHLSQNDKMHVLQVRRLRRGGAPRCCVHPSTQCRQREDIHFPLVLVPNFGDTYLRLCPVPSRHYHESQDEGVSP